MTFGVPYTRLVHDGPTWDELRRIASVNPRAEAAVVWAFDHLQSALGPSWPKRQFAKMGEIPPEVLYGSGHFAALPQLLWIALRLDSAMAQASFAPVLQELRRGVTTSGWRHVLLQLEVARALGGSSLAVTFEPPVPDTDRKADVAVLDEDDRTILVETTTLARSAMDLAWECYEDKLHRFLWRLEATYHVHTTCWLTTHLDEEATAEWLQRVELAAADAAQSGRNWQVQSDAGDVFVLADSPESGTITFSGAVREEDLWRRIARAVWGKVKQSQGSLPVWLRMDLLDGSFQFTEWRRMSWPERIASLSAALREVTVNARHLHGVVISSGSAASLGATDASVEDQTVVTTDGAGIRRLLAPHVARETAVIPLQPAAMDLYHRWCDAYCSEPEWLDEDLTRVHLPTFLA